MDDLILTGAKVFPIEMFILSTFAKETFSRHYAAFHIHFTKRRLKNTKKTVESWLLYFMLRCIVPWFDSLI